MLAVSQDEALSRRLNQLVTTGRRQPRRPRPGSRARELKNKCQYNKSGLLPQARQALAVCRETLQSLEALEIQAAGLESRVRELEDRKAAPEHPPEGPGAPGKPAKAGAGGRSSGKRIRPPGRTGAGQGPVSREGPNGPGRAPPGPMAEPPGGPGGAGAGRFHGKRRRPRYLDAPPPLRGLDGQRAREQVRQQLAALPHAGTNTAGTQRALLAGLGLLFGGLALLWLLPGLWKLPGAALLTAGGCLALWAGLRRRREAKAAQEASQALQALLAQYEVPTLQALEQWLQTYEADWNRYQEALAPHTRRQAELTPA